MPDVALVQHAQVSPTRCVTCHTHADPKGFVDTGVEVPGYGRIYLCVTSCVAAHAKAIGWSDPGKVELLQRDADVAVMRAEEAEIALGMERENKLVRLDDVRTIVAEIAAKNAKPKPARGPKATA